jgi:DNA mismatch repair protein MutS
VLHLLESGSGRPDLTVELPLFAAAPKAAAPPPAESAVLKRLAQASPDELTPRQALDLVYTLKRLAGGAT